MTPDSLNQTFEQGSVPPLALGLWALRKRMESTPSQVLNFVKNQKFSAVEIAGFFTMSASSLLWELEQRKIKVCGIHGPTLKQDRPANFHTSWARQYTELYKTKTFCIESSPTSFQRDPTSDGGKAYSRMVQLLRQIASDLMQDGIRVSYHCFPHDFAPLDDRPLVAKLFEGSSSPNLGIQLDTFWLYRSGRSIEALLQLPIHSVHLNERDNEGHCCLLGTNREKCFNYAKALAASDQRIDWILEFDTSEQARGASDAKQFQKIEECTLNWPAFWASLKKPIDENQAPTDTPVVLTESSERSSSPKVPPQEVAKIYDSEIRRTTTEHLFGKDGLLRRLPFNDFRVAYYVTARTRSTGAGEVSSNVEEEFFQKFWPPNEGPQILQIVGGAGSGKSTFLKYFFHYYLPHREALLAGTSEGSAYSTIYAEDVQRHLVVYVDLRRATDSGGGGLRAVLFKRLKESLQETLKYREIGKIPQYKVGGGTSDQDWVLRNVLWLAKQEEQGARRFYISWVLDNSDQLEEKEQRELMGIIHEFVPEEPPTLPASQPVAQADRSLWRVIMPIRPETRKNLGQWWSPLKNTQTFDLGVLNFDELMQKRATLLHDAISASGRHLTLDVVVDPERPHFDLQTPTEVADDLRAAWLAATRMEEKAEHIISKEARVILDHLCHDSARRRLIVFARAALSRPFSERYQRARNRQWRVPPLVSDFFLFDGLICGNCGHFEDDVEGLPIMNLFNLGERGGSPRSIFVGLHSLFLLKERKPWMEVKARLLELGYSDNDVSTCEDSLCGKELLKKLWNGTFITELSIVAGHWALLKERAYIDNMAVACAMSWSAPEIAHATDPSEYRQLPQRFRGSMHLMRRVWAAEREVFTFRSDGPDESFAKFSTAVMNSRFPSISGHILSGYKNISTLLLHESVVTAVKSDANGLKTWDASSKELASLSKEADLPVMSARRS
jgi:sugar phosphate isomerase/epimerase